MHRDEHLVAGLDLAVVTEALQCRARGRRYGGGGLLLAVNALGSVHPSVCLSPCCQADGKRAESASPQIRRIIPVLLVPPRRLPREDQQLDDGETTSGNGDQTGVIGRNAVAARRKGLAGGVERPLL